MDENKKLVNEAYAQIEEMAPLTAKDYHRLHYHIMPPTGLLNDPNGFIHHQGVYHMFYQFHPFGTEHGLKYWAHVKSTDLVRWKSLPIALAPSSWYETHGCYSGSAVDDDGQLTLIYTGNVKDDEGNRETYQCLARSSDGLTFEKEPNNPVIHNQPAGYTRHFRDPKVWKKESYWYMVIGTQTVDKEGRVLLLKSPDLKKWEFVGDVVGSNLNGLGDMGYMFECPDLFRHNGKDVLVTCPQGMIQQGDLYNNIYQAGYFVGQLDYKSGQFIHDGFIELDRGFEFYAPQTTLDQRNRRIMVGWMGLPEREDHPTTKYGWIHCLTLPRVLQQIDGKIFQKPVEELQSLRKDEIVHEGITINDETVELEGITGDVFEMIVEFEAIDAILFGIKLRRSQDGKEETLLFYDRKVKKFTMDRNCSGKGYGGIRRCALPYKDMLKIHIFSDTSSLEVFINDGEEVFSARIYPDQNSRSIQFFAKDGSIKLKKVQKWHLAL